jgi:GMP synthase (glutamine-hydrolysing)
VSRLLVAYVITEPRDRIDERARRDHRHEGGRLAEVCGGEVVACHYTDPLPPADVLVLSGSSAPWAAHDARDLDRLEWALAGASQPVLGICAGLQVLARASGGRVAAMRTPPEERGFCRVEVVRAGGLLAGLPPAVTVYQEHHDEVAEVPPGCAVLATSPACRVQAVVWPARRWWGTQFHPEWYDPAHPDGRRILHNFFGLAREALSGARPPGEA